MPADETIGLEDARAALAGCQAADDAKAAQKHTVAVVKAEARLRKAIARSTEVPVKPLNPRLGQRLLSEYRRQPRTFPSATPEDPRVTYVWPRAVPTNQQHTLLDGLLRRVVRIGHSSSRDPAAHERHSQGEAFCGEGCKPAGVPLEDVLLAHQDLALDGCRALVRLIDE